MNEIPIPQQVCWMIRQVINNKEIVNQLHCEFNLRKNMIRQIYLQLLGDYPKVPWKCLMFQNGARPKSRFTLWLMLHGKLLTTDRLLK